MQWQAALAGLTSIFSARGGRPSTFAYLLAGFGLALVFFDTGTRIWERRTERQRVALGLHTQRTWLVDSMRRVGVQQQLRLRWQRDSLLTIIYNRQAAAAELLRKRDELVQKRYLADRLLLPAW